MKIDFLLIGAIGVIIFFKLGFLLSEKSVSHPDDVFKRKIYLIALILRSIWVIFSYYFYINKTGIPFDFHTADALGYHEEALYLFNLKWNDIFKYLRNKDFADIGYPVYLIALYKYLGPSIIITRVLKAFISSYTCILIYKIAKRNFGEKVAKMAAIFTALMPNLIFYCGQHLKETEMIFLLVLFVENADKLLYSRKLKASNIIVTFLLCTSLFLFRTILGIIALIALAFSVVLSSNKIMGRRRKYILLTLGILSIFALGGGVIKSEIDFVWEGRHNHLMSKRAYQSTNGNRWAKYATGAVMAPMVFILPLSTMIESSGQETQMELHGGNFVKNFMGIFVLIGIFNALFISKIWNKSLIIWAMGLGYLLAISMTGFANAERFLLPGVPFLMIYAAYGVSQLKNSNIKYVKIWCFVVIIMEVGWAFFKLGGRGLL